MIYGAEVNNISAHINLLFKNMSFNNVLIVAFVYGRGIKLFVKLTSIP